MNIKETQPMVKLHLFCISLLEDHLILRQGHVSDTLFHSQALLGPSYQYACTDYR